MLFRRVFSTWSRLQSVVLLVTLCSPFRSSAQYYEPREYTPSESRFFHAGFFQRDFRPRGSNPTPDSVVIDFRRIMPVIGFRQGPADITVGYTTYVLKGTTRSTVFLGATFSQEVPLAGTRSEALVMPLIVSADFTKAEGVGFEREDFNIASVGLGLGLKYRYQGRSLEFSAFAAEAAQYSNEGLSVGSGFSALTLGDAILLMHGALVFDGVVLGYRFRYQTWSMNESRFNYRSFSHGPFIGVLF